MAESPRSDLEVARVLVDRGILAAEELGYRRLGRHAQAARSFEGALQAAVPDWPHRGKVENSLRKTLARIEAEGR